MPENFFEQPVPFLNIPFYYVIIIGAVIGLVYLIITRRPRDKEYKPLDLKKAIKQDMKNLYSKFGEGIGKPIYKDIILVGYIIGFMPLVWNRKIPIKDNLNIQNIKEVKEAMIQIKNEPMLNPSKKQKYIEEIVDMKILKVCKNNILSKGIAKISGFGVKYIIIESTQLKTYEDRMIINTSSQPTIFYDIFIFSKSSREFIENISFKINRENELQEIANIVPRTVFWDTTLAKWVARAREQADIEREKFRGQKEMAQE